MTALKLYKFVKDNEIEIGHDDTDVWIFVPFWYLGEFTSLVGSDFFIDSAYDCQLKADYVVIELKPICKYFGIDVYETLEPEKVAK